jgi:hypothetical protein
VDLQPVLFLLPVAVVLFVVASAKPDEMAAYLGHSVTAIAALLAITFNLGSSWTVVTFGVALFVINCAFLAVRIRHS